MSSSSEAPSTEEVLRRIRDLPGVARAESLSQADRSALLALATKSAAENRGVAEVLSRESALCMFKGREFRPPPEPTVLLIDETGRVLGREVLPGEDASGLGARRVVHLGKDFVLFADQPSGRTYRFLLPAVRFPELETVPGLEDVVSGSPDPPQDEYLRTRFRVVPGNDHASVLVGFNRRNP